MTDLVEMLEKISETEDYAVKTPLLSVVVNVLSREKRLAAKHRDYIKSFVLKEANKVTKAISAAPDYRTKNEMFSFGNELFGLCTKSITDQSPNDQDRELIDALQRLIEVVNEERVPANAIDEKFDKDEVDEWDMEYILSLTRPIQDEFQRGTFFDAILYYEKDAQKLTPEAKKVLTAFFNEELTAYLAKESLTKDEAGNLELACDACKLYADDETLRLLQKALTLDNNDIRYYAVSSLLFNKQDVSADMIRKLAEDLVYADLTYLLCNQYQPSLYPAEYADPEYLAKSDMIHWLTYPTELGKAPDKIELIGKTHSKGELFYVFRYQSDSDNLSDDLKNVWLIGWASPDGDTFSNFDKLSDFDKGDTKQTLKYIKNKLL